MACSGKLLAALALGVTMRRVASFACALMLLCLGAAPGYAEKRVALLIGNQAYNAEVGPLANPHNDIALVGQTLRGLGFDVTTIADAGFLALHQAINAHVRRLRDAGPGAIGFFYYSGHGALDEATGTDYLIPVDVASTDVSDLWDRSVRLTEITKKLKSEVGNVTHFVVFDACRNGLRLKKSGTRAMIQSKGFVPVREESGMLIAFATAEGELASDAGANAGTYARVLSEEIVRPGVEAVGMFRRVQLRVRVAINGEGGFKDRDLYPFCFNISDGRITASSQAAKDVRTLKDPSGKAFGNEIYKAAQDGKITEVRYLYQRPGETKPVEKVSFVTKAGDQGCGVGYYSPPANEAAQAWEVTQNTTSIGVLKEFIRKFSDSVYAASALERLDLLLRRSDDIPTFSGRLK